MPLIMVTGAAGFIGSVVTQKLLDEGVEVLAVDNLSRGHRVAIAEGATFYRINVGDASALEKIFGQYKVDAVVHLAGFTQVGESVENPALYYSNNLRDGLTLLETMNRCGISKMIFSSSAAVYGTPSQNPIAEDHPIVPMNPYGATKAVMENALVWYGKAYGLQSVSLRYFNAAGASGSLGENHHPETHLIPTAIDVAQGKLDYLSIYGDDYPTPDGTAIRDYVHVEDIAQAHIQTLEALGHLPRREYNIGTGKGYSVREVTDMASRVCLADIPVEIMPRRVGDPSELVADASALQKDLGWIPQISSIERIIQDAYRWHRDQNRTLPRNQM